MKIAGISSTKLGDANEGLLKNQNLYNDKEVTDDGDLGLYDFGFRIYDPQIGRFIQIDPLTDEMTDFSPYLFDGDEPIGNIDVDGLAPIPGLNGTTARLADVVVKAAPRTVSKAGQKIGGEIIKQAFKKGAIELLKLSVKGAGLVFAILAPSDAVVTNGYIKPDFDAVKARYEPKPVNLKPKDQDYITLYRGVHYKHPRLRDARQGMAIPRGGSDDPELHSGGNSFTNYTSWSLSRGVAQWHANKRGPGGIILVKKFKLSEITPSIDHFDELEMKVKGIVFGAKPEKALPGGVPTAY